MNGVEAIGRHVIRKAARAADAADEHRLLARDAEVRHRPLYRFQHRIVAAAGAPAHLLVARPVLGGRGRDWGGVVHGFNQMTRRTTTTSRISIGQTLSCFITVPRRRPGRRTLRSSVVNSGPKENSASRSWTPAFAGDHERMVANVRSDGERSSAIPRERSIDRGLDFGDA